MAKTKSRSTATTGSSKSTKAGSAKKKKTAKKAATANTKAAGNIGTRKKKSQNAGASDSQLTLSFADISDDAADNTPVSELTDEPVIIGNDQESTTPEQADQDDSPDTTTKSTKKGRSRKRAAVAATAETMAGRQREISVSEFFAKNRHLLGFDNPRKALLTTVKEAVDNALDACEEAAITPEIQVEIREVGQERYHVSITDNGPGIVKQQIPRIFGQLLYGSKFHTLKMARGQQGIGISAAGMYGLLTTGKPVRITSRTGPRTLPHQYDIQIDTRRNKPDIVHDTETEFDGDHGTKVEIELEARYQKGRQSVDEYLYQTAMANPHATFRFTGPDGRVIDYERAIDELPEQPREVKPHPHGIELGVMMKMLKESQARNLQAFMSGEFSRVSARIAEQIIHAANLKSRSKPASLTRGDAERLVAGIRQTKIMAPATDCVVPIGQDELLKGLQNLIPQADFYTTVTRPPAVYRGNPFQIEAALAYGGPSFGQTASDDPDDEDAGNGGEDQLVRLIRLANRVPLLYQQGACAMFKATAATNWKSYGMSQGRGALPSGPAVLMVHIASVWVPFTSESKEAVAHYPEILKEIRLAVQDCGRKLGVHLKRRRRMAEEAKKRSYIEKYIPHIGIALRDILDLKDTQVDKVVDQLKGILERSRKM